MTDLNQRARRILAAVVQEYLATGDAVGSSTVTRRHGIDLSPATVRNVMSDLEASGLLKQPHTSAGRVPTELGLRFFVDSLLKVRSLSSREREQLMSRYAIPTDHVDNALREASRVLAELSAGTVIVALPRPTVDVLEHLEFMRLPGGQLLAVLVTRSGHVQNKLITAPEPLSSEDLERMHNYLNAFLAGATIDEVRARIEVQLKEERTQYQRLERRALELSQQALPTEGVDVIVEGQARMVDALAQAAQTDPAELEKLKGLFRALEDKRRLSALLERTAQAEGIQVFIGAESPIAELSDFTLVTAAYGEPAAGTAVQSGDETVRPLGALGVIGPTRMNYSKVITLVDFTAQLVSDVIGKR